MSKEPTTLDELDALMADLDSISTEATSDLSKLDELAVEEAPAKTSKKADKSDDKEEKTQPVATESDSDDDLDDLLSELEDESEEAEPETSADDDDDLDVDALLADLEEQEEPKEPAAKAKPVKQKAAKPQTKKPAEKEASPELDELDALMEDLNSSKSDAVADGESTETEPLKKATKPKSGTKPAVERQPRPRRTHVVTTVGAMATPETLKAMGLENAEAVDELCSSLPVKAVDKVKNLIKWYQGEAELSIYTRICVDTLIKEELVNTADFKFAMMSNPDKPYTVGTAGSQAGQLMSVLPSLGLAKRKANTLEVNKESDLIKLYLKDAA